MWLCRTKCRVCKNFLNIQAKKMNNSKQALSSTFYCPFITQAEDSSALPIELNLHQLHLGKCQMVYGLLLRAVTYVKIWKKSKTAEWEQCIIKAGARVPRRRLCFKKPCVTPVLACWFRALHEFYTIRRNLF